MPAQYSGVVYCLPINAARIFFPGSEGLYRMLSSLLNRRDRNTVEEANRSVTIFLSSSPFFFDHTIALTNPRTGKNFVGKDYYHQTRNCVPRCCLHSLLRSTVRMYSLTVLVTPKKNIIHIAKLFFMFPASMNGVINWIHSTQLTRSL
jgi:hypothetical protein